MDDPIRIIAWGNTGRCDDGVGLVLADRLEERFSSIPHQVVVHQYHQLGPELTADLDRCRLAIFVDAHVFADREDVIVQTLVAKEPGGLDTHHCPPPALLALGASLGYHVPEAVMVCVRGYDMGFGDGLSEMTAAAMLRAERLIVEMVETRLGGSAEGRSDA